MDRKAFGAWLRKLRKKSGLTQGELARLVNTNQQRISFLENRGWASRDECVLLASVLEVSANEMLACLPGEIPKSELNAGFADGRQTYFPPCEKTGAERYQAALQACPDLIESIWMGLSEQQRSWLELASTDSLDEWIGLAQRAAHGLQPTFLSPQKVGIRQHPAVDWETGSATGDLAYPALIGEAGGVKQIIIPQLCLKTEKKRYRIDYALIAIHDRRRFVIDTEVDGMKHRSYLDDIRRKALMLPELRFGPGETFRPDFNELFDVRLRRLLDPLASKSEQP